MSIAIRSTLDGQAVVLVVVLKLYFDTVLFCKNITTIKKGKNTNCTDKLTTSSTNKKPALQGCYVYYLRITG